MDLIKARLAQQLRFAGWQEPNAIFVERLRAEPADYAPPPLPSR